MTTLVERRPAMNVLAAICAEHWSILPERLEQIISIAERTNLSVEALETQRGEPLNNTRSVSVRGGVATIPIVGPTFRYANLFTRVSGATSYADLATDLEQAKQSADVESVILRFDSPGGMVNGNVEAAGLIRALDEVKPVMAYIGFQGASAAYLLASAARMIIADPTAMIGSLGTVITVGRKNGNGPIEIVSEQSPFKRVDPETPEGKAMLQDQANTLAQVYLDHVARFRGESIETVLASYGQGGILIGQKAVDAGLADAVGSYEQVHAMLAAGDWPQERRSAASRVASAARSTFDAPGAGVFTSSHVREMKTPNTAAAPGNPDPAAQAPTAEAAASAAPAAPAAVIQITGAAPASGTELATARADAAERERERILGIQALGRPGEEKIVAECVADATCSIADAALRLRGAESQLNAGKLAALKTDEGKGAPAAAPTPTTEASSEEAQAAAILADYQKANPSRSR